MQKLCAPGKPLHHDLRGIGPQWRRHGGMVPMAAGRSGPIIIRHHLQISGIVQGVGFRPFIYRLALENALTGWVRNTPGGVEIEVQGKTEAVTGFTRLISSEAPPLAGIDSIRGHEIPLAGEADFTILPSAAGESDIQIAPDSALCDDCLRELFDPADRRYRYPFINCTNCGPRFTIVRDVPYDRPLTTMAPFRMCEPCAAEYHDPADRRFHAQPTCCPACGPRLAITGGGGDPLQAAAGFLRRGKVLAVKG